MTMTMLDGKALGFRKDGRVIRQYQGGSEGAPEGGAGDGGDDGGQGGNDGGSDLERLQQAIENERGLTKQARDALRPWRALAQELGVKSPDEVRSRLQALTKEQGDFATNIDQARAEAMSKANRRIVKSEIKALAASDFADPADAALYLKAEDYEVDDDGNVDERRIRADLADLLKRKPHLARVSRKVDFEGGARKKAEAPSSMNDTIRRLARR